MYLTYARSTYSGATIKKPINRTFSNSRKNVKVEKGKDHIFERTKESESSLFSLLLVKGQ